MVLAGLGFERAKQDELVSKVLALKTANFSQEESSEVSRAIPTIVSSTDAIATIGVTFPGVKRRFVDHPSHQVVSN